MYGHIHELAKAELRGIQAAGGNADIYQWVDHNNTHERIKNSI